LSAAGKPNCVMSKPELSGARHRSEHHLFARAIDGKENLRALLVHPLIWAISAVLFLYVGAEVGIGAWLYSYLRRAAVPLAIPTASAAVSVYWAGLIIGRLLGGAIAHRISARRLAAIGAIVSAVAVQDSAAASV